MYKRPVSTTKQTKNLKQGARRFWLTQCAGLLAVALGALSAKPAFATQIAASPTASKQPVERLLVLGDSLSAEYGLKRGTGWVALLEQKLAAEKRPVMVVNASISGETTSGGQSRLSGLIKQHRPAIVVVELGGNDALRGLPLQATHDHLVTMVRTARQSGARVLLIGMQVPPNYGRQYSRDFAFLFTQTARAEHAALVPFLLAGVADTPDADKWFQADKIHPLATAHPALLANVWPTLQPLLPSARP